MHGFGLRRCSIDQKHDLEVANERIPRGCLTAQIRHHPANNYGLDTAIPEYLLQRRMKECAVALFMDQNIAVLHQEFRHEIMNR